MVRMRDVQKTILPHNERDIPLLFQRQHNKVLGNRMRLFIADARSEIRIALMMYLSREPGIQVTGIAVEAPGLLAQVRATQSDVVLLDWQLPGASMQDLIADIRGLAAPPKIVVLSVNPEIEAPALAAGADAFISKNESPDRLLEAVR